METPASRKLLTLVILQQPSRILLGMKKRGLGVGRWNGFGGKVEQGEAIEEAAKREVMEESGIKVTDLEKAGVVTFEFEDDTASAEAHIFRSCNFTGEPLETDEMKPQWFDENSLPLEQMWTSDTYWIPLLLAGKKFKASFWYDRSSTADYASRIIKSEIEEVESLN